MIPRLEALCALLALALGTLTWALLLRGGASPGGVSPMIASLLLVATLIPIMALLVLGARRLILALAAGRGAEGGGRLHLRLVGLFAVVAAVPTLVLAAFAAMLFQYGVQFWFSDRARTVLVNADQVAQAYVEDNRRRLVGDLIAMSLDLERDGDALGYRSRAFQEVVFPGQVDVRNLTDAAVFRIGSRGAEMLARTGDPARPLGIEIGPAVLRRTVQTGPQVLADAGDRVNAVAAVDAGTGVFVYASRRVDPRVLDQVRSARVALNDYQAMTSRGGRLQLRFSLILVAVSLVLLALVIWAALRLATRLTAPLARLVEAAQRVGEGDFAARVPLRGAPDEIGQLSRTFNRMTIQLEAQNRALTDAGDQIDRRRRLTEAVLTGVSAGVIALDADGAVRLMNASAAELLALDPVHTIGRPVGASVPAFAELLERAELTGETASEVVLPRDQDSQTLAVRLVRLGAEGGAVLTFDDISQQLADQRRAAWADVARRIAHEIKNPLTPIQLAAERLQRKFGRDVANDQDVFSNLTGTIVRQVGDLRRIVDEFSAFARLPKPVFRFEQTAKLARQALTLQEVANPHIRYALDAPAGLEPIPCDRRQIAQALTNLLKNAAEGIEARTPPDPAIAVRIEAEPNVLTIAIEDNGVGLPAEARARLTEPYVTTRVRGTGLGLAIVKKIAEDHCAELRLEDTAGGGARVAMRFDLARLAALAADQPAPPALAAE